MSPRPRFLVAAFCFWFVHGSSQDLCAKENTGAVNYQNPTFSKSQIAFFDQDVLPILKAHCFSCHSGSNPKAGLNLSSRRTILQGGDSGPAIDFFEHSSSLLLQAINYESYEMPPKGKLPPRQIGVLDRWVAMRLPWNPDYEHSAEPHVERTAEPQVNAETMSHWSYQPITRPKVPTVSGEDWVGNPIDSFVLKRLEDEKLRPSPRAGRLTLLRRAYYDLTGLPPSLEQTQAYLKDESPDAFERVIDELLDSPHYGEKWGRHWLDLVRYAETNSYERDNPKPFVWRYRDYVINSFNDDKPFDLFIREQLAGDELPTATRESIIATGYYRLGIWDDEPADPLLALYDELDDIITTTGQVLLGMTLNCARCHNHKIDAVPQEDYYRFLAFFNGLNRYGPPVEENSLREIATDEEKRLQKKQIAAHRRRLEENKRRIKAIESLVVHDFAPVEREEFMHENRRIDLVKKRVPRLVTREQFDRYVALTKQRKSLRRSKPSALSQALAVTEIGARPRATFVLIRGNPRAKGKQVAPGFPAVLNPPDPSWPAASEHAESSGRRLALARWIASAENPLTARVLANRLWQYHFGHGIVRTPNKFGRHGEMPSHPKLLDWLACELIDREWRLKGMHKLIMMSKTYQMSSRNNSVSLARDPENRLLWRFHRRRLTAEEVRDSILFVTDQLNPKMFGPSIKTAIPREILQGQSQPGKGWNVSSPEEQRRRSIYIHIKRSLPVPILATYDAADPDFTCPVRFATTQPTQSLAMMNGEFVSRKAAEFADSLRSKSDDPRESVRRALARVCQRPAMDSEVDRGLELIDTLRKDYDVATEKALEYFCLVALNLNEFVYLD